MNCNCFSKKTYRVHYFIEKDKTPYAINISTRASNIETIKQVAKNKMFDTHKRMLAMREVNEGLVTFDNKNLFEIIRIDKLDE